MWSKALLESAQPNGPLISYANGCSVQVEPAGANQYAYILYISMCACVCGCVSECASSFARVSNLLHGNLPKSLL